MANGYHAALSRGAREDSLEADRELSALARPHQLRFSQRQRKIAGSLGTASYLAVEPGTPKPGGSAKEEPAQSMRSEIGACSVLRSSAQNGRVRHVNIIECSA